MNRFLSHLALVLAVISLFGPAAYAVDDPDPRARTTGSAGIGAFGLDGDAPLLENPAGTVQTGTTVGSGGLTGGYARRAESAERVRDRWTAAGSIKTVFPVWDFAPYAKGYRGRLNVGGQVSVSYAHDTLTDDSEAGRVTTVTQDQRFRLRPTLAFGFADEFALGAGIDIGGRIEQVETKGPAGFDLVRENAVIFSPVGGFLVTPIPSLQLGGIFDLGFVSDELDTTYEIDGTRRRDTFRTVQPRVAGGGAAVRLPGLVPTTLALDVQYTFRAERNGGSLVKPALAAQIGAEAVLDPAIVRAGFDAFSEQEEGGRDEYRLAAGAGISTGRFRWNVGGEAAYQVDHAADEDGWRFGLILGGAFQ